MKHILTTIALLLSALNMSAQQGYVIKGIAEGAAEGDTVYLCSIKNLYVITRLDSTIISNGKYEFRGEQSGCVFRYLIPYHNGKAQSYSSVLLEDAEITVRSFPSDTKKESEVSSTGLNYKLWQEYKQLGKPWSDELVANFMITRDSTATKANQRVAEVKMDSLRNLQRQAENQFMREHLPAAICDIILGSNYASMSDEEKQQTLKLFSEKLPDGANYRQLAAEAEVLAPVAVGKKFTDFTMQNPDGKDIKVSDIVAKNKYTLIDFWASWCGPCRTEMPYVLETYDKYHSQGFEVVGVSLDNKHEAWIKAIEDLALPWPQMSDLKGWQCEGAAIYKVRAIPANILVDQQGIIRARDLRGLKLTQKINELLMQDGGVAQK